MYITIKNRYLFIFFLAVLSTFTNCKKDTTSTTIKGNVATLTTGNISDITAFFASCGGNITNDGGTTVTSRGVCWSTGNTPTIADNKTTDGDGAGIFSSKMTGLNFDTKYYVRAYATNSAGTGYGSTVSFNTTSSLPIGASYAGGIVFYVDSTGKHGFVAATEDQSEGCEWGCYGTSIPGAHGVKLGEGQANTKAIVNSCFTIGIAARICDELTLNGYDDWFLPSVSELIHMMDHDNKISGLKDIYEYWSSTEYGKSNAETISSLYFKNSKLRVRAIRAF